MKYLLMIFLGLLLLLGLGAFYTYSSLTHIPESIEMAERLDVSGEKQKARTIAKRIEQELQSNGEIALNGAEFKALVVAQIDKRGKIDIANMVKKMETKLEDGQLKVEALVNFKKVSEKVPQKVKGYIESITENLPESMLEEVYVSFKGMPILEGTNYVFDENAHITVGDFSYQLSKIKGNSKVRLRKKMLQRLGVSSFEMVGDKIVLKK